MKSKKWTLGLALLSLAFVLTSSILIGATYSKYYKVVDNGTKTAQVSKFGVTLTEWTGTLFQEVYGTVETGEGAYAGDAVNMAGEGILNALAPGLSGSSTATVAAAGSEVAVRIQLTYNIDYTGDWEVTVGETTAEYKPVTITVKYGDVVQTITADGIEHTLELAELDPGESLETKNVEISWSWAWSADDARDTLLGEKTTDMPGISVAAKLEAVQIQPGNAVVESPVEP